MTALARFFCLLFSASVLVHGQQLKFAQVYWRHGLRTPIETYANDPYNETFFGVPDGALLPHGMEQHFRRGQQLRQRYVEELRLVNSKYSAYETYVRSSDLARCIQSGLANMAGFYAGSPTFPAAVPNWPSGWTPIPIYTVPKDKDFVMQVRGGSCPKYGSLKNARAQRKAFRDFVANNYMGLLHTINANWGNTQDYTFSAISQLHASLEIERSCNLTIPGWVTDDFFHELETAFYKGHDFVAGEAGFGLPMDPEIAKMNAGFLLNEWMTNIDAVINSSSTLKYYAYSGIDTTIRCILIGLGVKQSLIGPGNADYASTIVCELWEKDGQHFVKLLFSPNISSEFTAFTSKLSGCGGDLCLLSDFRIVIQPLIATDTKICFN